MGDGPNTYLYTQANPLSYIDPTGQNAIVEGVGILCTRYPRACLRAAVIVIDSINNIAQVLSSTDTETGSEEEDNDCECKDDYPYGPFYRDQSMNKDVIDTIVASQQLWGTTRRDGYAPAAKAKRGPIPSGISGVQFCSAFPPRSDQAPWLATWYKGDPGVFPVPNKPDHVGIDIRTTKVQR